MLQVHLISKQYHWL